MERKFVETRKQAIKDKLHWYGLSQSQLGQILGHTKGYMSELINGKRPMSMKDIVILNWLFKIHLDVLVDTKLDGQEVDRILHVLYELGRKDLAETIKQNIDARER